MKKFLNGFRNPMISVITMAAAIVLLAFAVIGAVRMLIIPPKEYKAQMSMEEIGITLLENGNKVANRDYVFDDETKTGSWNYSSGELLSAVPDSPVLMKKYPEELKVQNSQDTQSKNHERIDEYVRVTILRYWLDENGNESRELSPKLIRLSLNGVDLDDPEVSSYGAWIKDMDPTASTALRTEDPGEKLVFYYNAKLAAGETTSPVTDSIAIDNSIADKVTAVTSADGKAVTTVYEYDGWQFCLEVTADAVQDHNAADAMKSAWGIDPAELGLSVTNN